MRLAELRIALVRYGLAVIVFGLAFWSCTTEDRPAPDQSNARAAVLSGEILWGGCDEVKAPRPTEVEPICVLRVSPDSPDVAPRLRLWVPADPTDVFVSLDGEQVEEIRRDRRADGTTLELQLRHDGQLWVEGGGHGLGLRLEIKPHPFSELVEARERAKDSGTLAAFIAEQSARLEGMSDAEKVYTLEQLQIALYVQGQYEEAARRAQEFAALARGLGWSQRACTGLWVAAYTMDVKLRRSEDARALFESDQCHVDAIAPAEILLFDAYYRGILANGRGQLGSAARRFGEAIVIARRLQWGGKEQMALEPLVDVLAIRGRFTLAKRLLRRFEDLDDPKGRAARGSGCEVQARYHEKRAKLAFRALQSMATTPWSPEREWEQAIEAYRDPACGDPGAMRSHGYEMRLDLARLAFVRGQPARARAELDRIPHKSTRSNEASLGLRYPLLRAELALERGRGAEATRLLGEIEAGLDELDGAAGFEEQRWRYHLLRARSFEQRGAVDEALSALAEAEAELLPLRHQLKAALERDRHAAMHRDSGIVRVRLHLGRGDLDAALCAARLARAGGLLSLVGPDAAPEDCAALPEPGEDEVALLFHHDGAGWLGFAWRRGRPPVVRSLGSVEPGDSHEELGHELLLPFADTLTGAERLRVLPAGPLTAVPFEALEWLGHPLVDSMAVTYALDLPTLERPAAKPATAHLVFSAAQLRLKKFLPRLEQWASELRRHGYAVEATQNIGLGESLTAHGIAADTRSASLALFFGTGRPRDSAFERLLLLESARQALARDDVEPDQIGFELGIAELGPAQVPYNPADVPQRVILAACDSALTDTLGATGATGLAQSYVLAGSSWVVGTATRVEADSAVEVVGKLLELDVAGSDSTQIARALQRVQRARRDAGDPEWHAYHLWTR